MTVDVQHIVVHAGGRAAEVNAQCAAGILGVVTDDGQRAERLAGRNDAVIVRHAARDDAAADERAAVERDPVERQVAAVEVGRAGILIERASLQRAAQDVERAVVVERVRRTNRSLAS